MATEVRKAIEYRRLARLSFFLIASMLFLVLPVLGKEKTRDWQTGKVVSAEARDAGAVAIPIGGLVIAKGIQRWVYVIETESLAYELLWRSKKSLNLTIGGQVKFAVENNNDKAFVIDEEGKERQLSIVAKRTKETER